MKYPIGVQSFEKIRKDGLVYVDKTALIYDLTHRYNTVFLGRPRRFGKSLLMSTIQAYFEGKREFFEGLAIEHLENDWTRHPVLHFDLNTGDYADYGKAEIERVLSFQLKRYEKIYGGIDNDTISNRFLNVIESAYQQTGQSVVVLIDEYDKPVLATMDNDKETQKQVRNTLKSFYGCMKSYGEYLRFIMLTGVSKFGKLSVFSDLNNIEDVSLNKIYAEICGLTKGEIIDYFSDEIDAFAEELEVSREQMIEKLRKKYDGYRFSKAKKLVFNPYSLLRSLKNKELDDYWFETGTPTFLVNLLQKYNYDLSEIAGISTHPGSLYKVDNITAIPLLYQTGYLTIKDYDLNRNRCKLGYPNEEVESAFFDFLLPYYSNLKSDRTRVEIDDLTDEICAGDVDSFMRRMKSLFYLIPYAQDNTMKVQEDQFRNLMYITFHLLGFQVQVECHMSHGRSDAVVKTAGRIYVFEFKVNSTADAALAQIHDKHYAEPYLTDGRPVTLVGVNYSTTDRAITEWKME